MTTIPRCSECGANPAKPGHWGEYDDGTRCTECVPPQRIADHTAASRAAAGRSVVIAAEGEHTDRGAYRTWTSGNLWNGWRI